MLGSTLESTFECGFFFRQDPNRLQLPANVDPPDQTPAPVKVAKKKKPMFGRKTVKVQAWKGPEANYDTVPRTPSKVNTRNFSEQLEPERTGPGSMMSSEIVS